MTDGHGEPSLPRQRLEALELLRDLLRRRIRIQEHVPLDRRHAPLRCDLQRDAVMRRVTVDEVEPAGPQNFFHQPVHVARVPREQAAAMTIHAHGKRDRLHCGRESVGERFAGRIEGDRAGFCCAVMIDGLQRQVQKHFLAALPGGLCQLRRSRCAGQDRTGHRARQRDGAMSRCHLVAEVVDDNGDAWSGLREALRREQEEYRGGAELCERH